MAAKEGQKASDSDVVVDLAKCFSVDNEDSPPLTNGVPDTSAAPVEPVADHRARNRDTTFRVSREQLIVEQKRDVSLSTLFELVVSGNEADVIPVGYVITDGVLVRRWTPRAASTSNDWNTVTQIVVPKPLRGEILRLAHDDPFAGNLGVKKTFDRILRCFFWPGLKRDIKQHCKTCRVCQACGKSNEGVPSYPLYPIPVMGEPFDRVIVDCVGPLPRTKAGNKFLLTMMCATTRFPEAVPLRGITTAAILKALQKFFSVFGLPKVVQTDQGTNFMSRIFSQVMKQLGVSHHYASAYHPESQGALERFHAILKSMLCAYCFETGCDWDEGVHLLLLAMREVIQESLGFSPADLVFAHTVRGPLSLVYDKSLSDQKQQNLCDYVSNFRFKLHRACQLAKQKLSATQAKMKTWFDKDAKSRTFKPGDKV